MWIRTIVKSPYSVYSKVLKRCNSTTSWDLMTGVCVERMPLVVPPLTELQGKFKKYLETVESEKSLKSDHELRQEKDRIQAELHKNESIDVDLDTVNKVTAQDFEDACNEEIAKFKFADINTDADKNNHKSSLQRSLQRHLVLVAKQKIGDSELMILPQGTRQDGETLRQTAERVLSEHCGSELTVQFLGNAPCGYYKYKYPSEINGKIGAKIFFYYAKHLSGNLDNSNRFQWLTRAEIGGTFPARYHRSVTEFLVEEKF